MVLNNLHLQNFKRYKEYSLEFTQGLVGIIGKNGSGKSTIFESILFALYGELKTKGYKEIIRNADASTKDPVVVELEFEYDNTLYKVLREFRGKTLSAQAKLFKNEELIVSGAKEVTQSIVKLTKMSKDAFLHTLFASQKELTSLSSLKNEDRKKMIRKLLGLEKIDFIEKELIETTRSIKRELEAFKEILLSDEEIESKNQSIKKYQEQISHILEDAELKEKELDSLKLKELDLKKELDVFIKTKEQKQKLYSNLEIIKNNIDANINQQKKITVELKELDKKQKEYDDNIHIKIEFENLEKQLNEQNRLKEISLKKEGLLKEQEQLRVQYTKTKSDIKSLEKECIDYEEYKNNLNVIEQVILKDQQYIKDILAQEKDIRAIIAGEQKIIDDTNIKIHNLRSLGKDSSCPTCTRPLLEEYDKVIESLKLTVENVYQNKIKEYKEKLVTLVEQKEFNEKELKQKEIQKQELIKNISIIQSKQNDLVKAKEYFKKVESKGIENKKELESLESFSYDEQTHKNMQDKYNVVRSKYQHLLNLQTQLKRVEGLNVDYKNISIKIDDLNKQYDDKEIEFKSVNYDEKTHLDKKQEFEIVQKHKDEKVNIVHELKIQSANLKGQIDTIKTTLDNNQKQLEKLKSKKDDLKDYEKIKISLGEFKTKLNSKVAPRISDVASNMYSTITKGKYQHIEVSNDFDFFIYDEGIKYPIERFSGGEVDLANLVLRIAISKTLAELNGTNSVGFLAFDEVFGSQDESRRMMILEAFHTIKEQYRQIFLISHEIEIKEMFERVVEL